MKEYFKTLLFELEQEFKATYPELTLSENYATFAELSVPKIIDWLKSTNYCYRRLTEGEILEVKEGKLNQISTARNVQELQKQSKELIQEINEYSINREDPILQAVYTIQTTRQRWKYQQDNVYRFMQVVLDYLRALKIVLANMNGGWTHSEKRVMLRAVLAQLETTMQNIYKDGNSLYRGYSFTEDLTRTDLHLQDYRNKIKELEEKIAILQGEKKTDAEY